MSTPNPERLRRFLDKVQDWMDANPGNRAASKSPSDATDEEVELRGNRQFDLEVKGESHYQEAIRAALKANNGSRFVVATLVLEDDNPYDRNAVAVEVNGGKVGHLSREAALLYREQLKLAGKPRVAATCRAKIAGGSADKPSYGIWLDIPVERE
jgi:hypothetical protein